MSARLADRFRPEPPRMLEPGDGWSGTFSASGRLPRGAIVRVVTGPCAILGRPPRRLFRELVCVAAGGARVR